MKLKTVLTNTFIAACGVQAVLGVNPLLGEAELPSCSISCIDDAIATAPEIAQRAALLCYNIPLEKSLSACIKKSCSFNDQNKVFGNNAKLCSKTPGVDDTILATSLIIGVMGTVAQTVIAMRLYSRRYITKELAIDDYLIIGSAFMIFSVMCLGTATVCFGQGRHFWNVAPDRLPIVLAIFWIEELIYTIEMVLVKCSILCFFLRVFPNRRFMYAVYFMVAFVILAGIGFSGSILFQCSPVRSVFDKSKPFTCIDNRAATWYASGVSILQDLMILTMPLPLIFKLKMRRRKKVAITTMFSAGVFATAVSIIRLPYIGPFGNSVDPTYDNALPAVWTFAEMGAAVITACLPALRPLVSTWAWFPKIFTEPSPRPSDESPAIAPPRNQGFGFGRRVPAAFTSLFSRNDRTSVRPPKYFGLKQGKIVALNTRFSRFSIDLEKELEKKNIVAVQNPERRGNESEKSGVTVTEEDMHPRRQEQRLPTPSELFYLPRAPPKIASLSADRSTRRQEGWEENCI